jgi:hypothetical protein
MVAVLLAEDPLVDLQDGVCWLTGKPAPQARELRLRQDLIRLLAILDLVQGPDEELPHLGIRLELLRDG